MEALATGQSGGGDGITTWDVTHPKLLLLSYFGTIMPSRGTHVPGEVSGCRGASWRPAMLRAGRSSWHLFGPPV